MCVAGEIIASITPLRHAFVTLLTFVFAAFTSIVYAALSLFPKTYSHRDNDPTDRDLLHFSGIGQLDLIEYRREMSALLGQTDRLSAAVVDDLYHLSRDVLAPKFRWLRLSYVAFIGGSMAAVFLYLARVFGLM